MSKKRKLRPTEAWARGEVISPATKKGLDKAAAALVRKLKTKPKPS